MNWPRKTHCKRGHSLTDPNLIHGGDGRRKCLACHQLRCREYYGRNKAKVRAKQDELRKAKKMAEESI